MAIWGMWSEKYERWYISQIGVIFTSNEKRIVSAQHVSATTGLAQQRQAASRENHARMNQWQAAQQKKTGIQVPKLLGPDGRPIPGREVGPIPEQLAGVPGAPQMIVVDDPKWVVAEILSDGMPRLA